MYSGRKIKLTGPHSPKTIPSFTLLVTWAAKKILLLINFLVSTNVFLNSMRGQIPPYRAFLPWQDPALLRKKSKYNNPSSKNNKNCMPLPSPHILQKLIIERKWRNAQSLRDAATFLTRKAVLKNSSFDPLQAQQLLLKPQHHAFTLLFHKKKLPAIQGQADF